MKISASREKFALALLIVPALLLPGCGDWLKAKFCGTKPGASATEGAAVVTMDGRVVITTQSFEKEFEQLLEENPHLKSVIALMPDAKKNFLQGMINQEVVDKWVAENKVDAKEEYKQEMERMVRSVKRMLNTKYFGLEHPVQVTETEVTEFYDKNKDTMPDLMISRGGVKAVGVSFEKEADARAFVAKANSLHKGDVTKAADNGKMKNFRDFKMVNAQSLGMDVTVRDQIVNFQKFPTVELIKVSDNSFWVVGATSKEETKYRPLDQVKAGLEQYVAKEKRMEMFDKEITKLKDNYKVSINEEALMPKQEQTVADAQTATEENAQAVAQAPEQAVEKVADANVEAPTEQAAQANTTKAA